MATDESVVGTPPDMAEDEDDVSRRKRLAKWNDRLFYEPVRKPDGGGRHAPRLPKFLPSLIVLLIIGLIGTWFVFASLARLRGSEVSWFWPDIGSLSADGALFDVTRSTATLAALAAGLFAAVYAYRKQRVDEAAGKRADDESLSKRYQDAAEQIGHDKAAVRLAGVYGMARLADDWPEQRQTCVDVICAYLRSPLPSSEDDRKLEMPIREAISAVIQSRIRLTSTSSTSWSRLRLDVRGAHFDEALASVTLRETGELILNDCVFASSHPLVLTAPYPIAIPQPLSFELVDESSMNMRRTRFETPVAIDLVIDGRSEVIINDVLFPDQKAITLREIVVKPGAVFKVKAGPFEAFHSRSAVTFEHCRIDGEVIIDQTLIDHGVVLWNRDSDEWIASMLPDSPPDEPLKST